MTGTNRAPRFNLEVLYDLFVEQPIGMQTYITDSHGHPISQTFSNETLQELASDMWWQTTRVIPMIAMIVYDHIITIPEEVKMLWSRRKSFATIVIIVNRYALLAYGAFLIAILLPITENPLLDPVCKTLYFFGNVCTWILLIAGIVFDCLRIYGITQGTGRIIASFTVGLLGIICITPVFMAITSVSTQGQIGTMASFGGGTRSGCQDRFPTDYHSMHGLNRWLYTKSTFSIAFEASVLGIILFRTLGVKRAAAAVGLRTSLIDLLVRDGKLPHACISGNFTI
ncbi:hypothetical protein QCA50_015185 [Cerrena zonata]|uniref:DUF6533 domain-containing protein n=1 Tax=Cerrena zonata TaxID=2478898 RepID=A0AAW0FL14_9APHY